MDSVDFLGATLKVMTGATLRVMTGFCVKDWVRGEGWTRGLSMFGWVERMGKERS